MFYKENCCKISLLVYTNAHFKVSNLALMWNYAYLVIYALRNLTDFISFKLTHFVISSYKFHYLFKNATLRNDLFAWS